MSVLLLAIQGHEIVNISTVWVNFLQQLTTAAPTTDKRR